MTIMMNCPHSGEGWCLECVRELDREREELLVLLRAALKMQRNPPAKGKEQ